eukprot:6077171-Prymnesium_polylepis.1
MRTHADACGRMQTDVDGCGRMWRDAEGCGGIWWDVEGCAGTRRDVGGMWSHQPLINFCAAGHAPFFASVLALSFRLPSSTFCRWSHAPLSFCSWLSGAIDAARAAERIARHVHEAMRGAQSRALERVGQSGGAFEQ